jgi:trehalose 6-phosphate synthase
LLHQRSKEYVAAQDPEDPGVLVLSQFAGVVHKLERALIVNPYDVRDSGEAVDQALRMPLAERRERCST